MARRDAIFELRGGLDLVTAAASIPPGRVIGALNYESSERGYRRIDGFERADGQPKPSLASYWVIEFESGDTAISIGATVTGQTSGATGILLVAAIIESGSIGGADAAGKLVLTNVSGTFQDAENLQVSAATVAVSASVATESGAENDSDHNTWLQAAIAYRRTQIAAVPGSGDVLGVWCYNDALYAFRNNAGGTAAVMHKATSSGWSAQALGRELEFTEGGVRELTFTGGGSGSPSATAVQVGDTIKGAGIATTAIVKQVIVDSGAWATSDAAGRLILTDQTGSFTTSTFDVIAPGTITSAAAISGDSTQLDFEDGDVIEGLTSGATATITRVVLEDGEWADDDAQGRFIFASQTGTFQAEYLTVSGGDQQIATIAGDSSAITLPAGGRYSFANYNFTGASSTERMYGVNGVGRGFEWDGTVFVPINTGMASDIPIRIAAHRNHLFFAFSGGSLQHSSIGNPYQWSVITGAGEIGIGEEITGLLADVSGALSIFGQGKVAVLLGTDSANWELRTLASDAGAKSWTMQNIGQPIYVDNRGLRSLETTDRYGDFITGTMTQLIYPLFKAKAAAGVTPVGSVRIRAKDQYRLFWSDGTGIIVYFGRQQPEVTLFDLGFAVTCVESCLSSTGVETIHFGSSTGMVYELDAGTSFDGSVIEAFLRMPFNNIGSHSYKKRFHKVQIDVDCPGQSAVIGVLADFDYAAPSAIYAEKQNLTAYGSGGFWGETPLGGVYWSAPVEGTIESRLDGIGRNISVVVASESATETPHTIQTITIHYSPRGMAR